MNKLCIKCAEMARRNSEMARIIRPPCAFFGFVAWRCDDPECAYHPSNK
jgi:hypothetical protein